MIHRYQKANYLTFILLLVYLITLVWIIVFKLNIEFSYMSQERSMNLVPFDKPLVINGKTDLGEQFLNVLIFLPMGLYFGILLQKQSVPTCVLIASLISLILESCQYILAIGAFDITDIITNTTGGILGLGMFKICELIFGNKTKAQRFLNILALLFTIIVVGGLLYLKINKLLMFRR